MAAYHAGPVHVKQGFVCGRGSDGPMDLHLAGKKALVTGGSAGIGLACAKTLVAEGVDVAIASRSAEKLADAEAILEDVARHCTFGTPRIVTIAADLSQAGDVLRTAHDAEQAFGQIDILINNAGSTRGGSFFTLPDEAFVDGWTLKLLGYIRMCRALGAGMVARRSGSIINIAGGAGRTPAPTFLTGSTGNAAIINFTRGLSKELAPHQVRVNAISPGTTATERADRLLLDQVTPERSIEEVRFERDSKHPMKRITQPDEIASMAALICSDRVPTMTGGEVIIDGGSQPGV